MQSLTLLASVLAGLLVVAAFYVGFSRLIKKTAPEGAALGAIRDERDRLLRELEHERQLTNTSATDIGRLMGRQSTLESELEDNKREYQAATTQMGALQARLESETIAARTALATLSERDHALNEARRTMKETSQELAQAHERLNVLNANYAQVSANLLHSQRANEEIKIFLRDAQDKLSSTFAELAGKTLDEKAQIFEKNMQASHTQSRSDIEVMLKPLSDRVIEFRQRLDTVYGEEAKERSALLGAVTELKTLNQDMAAQAAALTGALKGSSKVRGDWGELMLENVLRGSGLEEGKHYSRQVSTSDESGDRLQPDIVVRLPDKRLIVVDSKVNLVAWQEAMNAETPEAHQEALRRHSVALRQHIRELGDKNYPKAIGENALEMTIAFVPIEGALSAALGFDSSLQTDAFDRKVVFASPNTLMAVLRVVERLWTRDKIQRQAAEIGDVGGRLLDSLTNFLAEFDSVGKRLNDASKAFGEARRTLSESPQAAIPRARRLAELGVRGRKALSDELASEEPDLLPLNSPKE